MAATYLNSTLEPAELKARQTDLDDGKYQLLYVAPERLLAGDFPRKLSGWNVGAIAVDEAHCISEWGHDFRPEYRQLHRLRTRFADIPIAAFTATATERVRQDIVRQLALREPCIHVASFNRPNLHYAVRPKTKTTYTEVLERARANNGAGIVYCLSRKRVDEIASRLQDDGIRALPYHAGLEADTLWSPIPGVTARIDALVDSVRMLRGPSNLAVTSMLATAHGARILETYTLTQGVLAEVEIGELLAIAARRDVRSIQPASSGDLPPSCANPTGTTISQAKQVLRTNSYGWASPLSVLHPPR